MTKPLLVVDAYLDPKGGAHNYLGRLGARPVEVVAAAHEACPTSAGDFAGLFVTGSGASVCAPAPWVESAADLMRDAADRRVPVLGVCFGHQLLAYALFGPERVRQTSTPELGWVEIERTREHPLLEGFGPRFTAFESHRDEVVPEGEGIRVLARNAACAVQAMELTHAPCFGVQFHPEMGLEEIEALIHERAAEPAGAGFEARELLATMRDTSLLGDLLIKNFLRHVGLA